MRDPYLYDDADVLINKGNIKDVAELRRAEGDITKCSMNIIYAMKFDKFNTSTLCEIHKVIFGGIYNFAGEFCTIQMTKAEEVLGGDTVHYSYPSTIKKDLDTISKEIAKLKPTESKKDLIFKIVRITAALWQVHPFREGNTRAIVCFSVLLAANLEIALNYSMFEKHASFVRNSLVWGCQGIYSKFEYLERIYFDAAGILDQINGSSQNSKNTDYTVINGYHVADYKEMPHIYTESKGTKK